METTKDKIIEFAKNQGGYITLDDCKKLNIHKTVLFEIAKKGNLKKCSSGIYALPDTIVDELFLLHLRFPQIVFSHYTALNFLGYSDQVPFSYSFTVPKGFHSKDFSSYKIFQTKRELLEDGKTEVLTEYQNKIPVYCIERTLCDILHSPKTFDKERFLPAIKKYLSSSERDNIRLLYFAKLLRVENKIRMYMEAVQ